MVQGDHRRVHPHAHLARAGVALGDPEQLDAIREQVLERVQLKLAAGIDGRHLENRAGLIAQHLPGNDIGMMGGAVDQNQILRL